MYTKKSILLLLLISLSIPIFSQERILYVDGFKSILGDEKKEIKLLTFAKENNFSSLILYELDKIDKKLFHLADNTKNSVLVNFMVKARKFYGIKEIAASGESGGFFIDEIAPYNSGRTDPNERFDVYNLEYEYWKYDSSNLGGYYCENYLRKNEIPCNREGSYNYYKESLSIMKLLAEESDTKIKTEAYLGNFKSREINKISKHTDRILISGYANTPENSFTVVKKLLKLIANCECKPEVSVIFSSEVEYMKGYLNYHSLDVIEDKFIKEMKRNNLYNKVNLVGFTYYNYSYLEDAVENETFRRTGIRN